MYSFAGRLFLAVLAKSKVESVVSPDHADPFTAWRGKCDVVGEIVLPL